MLLAKTYFQNVLGILAYPNIEHKSFLATIMLTTLTFWLTSAMLFSAGLFLLMMMYMQL